ncbi:MAG: HK97 gp10 family phage protein [Pseudomonadota bacterium]
MSGPFKMALSQFAAKAGERADEVVRGVTLELASRIIVRSPVDTGRFRANWRLGVGGPVSGTLETTDKDGQGALSGVAAALPQRAAGTVLYLTNNLPYAWRLENGWSGQAPIGMVAITALEFNAIVDGVAGGLEGVSSMGIE